MKITTLGCHREYKSDLLYINDGAWPKFMLNWECSEWSHLFSTFEDYQILILEEERLVAFGHTIPLYWDKDINFIPDNLKELVEMSVENYTSVHKPNILLVLAAVVTKEYLNKGLSFEILKAMKGVALKNDIEIIVPVRPTLKHKYPLIPIKDYAMWVKEDGLQFDPWLRVHKKLDGKVFKTSDECMLIKGTVKEWEEWTGLKIPGSGEFIIGGALNPLKVNIDKNIGEYADPCIWVKYYVK